MILSTSPTCSTRWRLLLASPPPPPAEKKKAMAVFLKQASPAHLPDMCRF